MTAGLSNIDEPRERFSVDQSIQVWQEWNWNQALGIHRGTPIQVLTPLTGA